MLATKGRKALVVFLLFFLPIAFGAGNKDFLESQSLKGGKSFERLQSPQNRTIAPAKLTQSTALHRDLNRGGEVPIGIWPDDQEYPAIYGDKIVYQGWTTGGWNIAMYDLTTGQGKDICTAFLDQLYPAIYGDKIVWQDWRNRNWDIYMYDLSTGQEKAICTNTWDQMYPAIYGDKIVWQDNRNGNWDIYMYDLTTGQEKAICTEQHDQMHPAIYGGKIVWQDNRNGNWDIYMYDLTTGQEKAICTDTRDQMYPAIYGDKIVWQDWRNGNWDIYMYDLSTGKEKAICTDPHEQEYPAIYGDKIVWQDDRNFNWDIYMYDLSTGQEKAICRDPNYQEYPKIHSDKIVWQDNRNGNWDIYMYQLSPTDTTPPTVPGNLKAKAISSIEINLSWDASTDEGGSGLAGYSIERRKSGEDFSEIARVDANTTIYKDTGLTANTTYEYRVRAYDNAGNYSDYSNIASTATEKIGKWTVMVYISYKNNLTSQLGGTLKMLSSVGSTADVRLIAQVMLKDQTERFYFKQKMENACPLPVETFLPVGSAEPDTLTDFINWATQNYPAEHYVLIINDHGAGWREDNGATRGISQDDSRLKIMSIPELRKSLENAKVHFDLIGMDACLMQMLEVASEIKDWANAICTSEAIMYLWPYDKFLPKLLANPYMNEVDLGKEIVNTYVGAYEYSKEVALSLISTSSISQLAQAVDKLAGRLISIYPAQKDAVEKAIKETQNFSQNGGCEEYKDLFHFAANIYMELNDGEALSLAKDVISLKGKVVLYEQHTKGYPHASGLSIYLPEGGFDGNYTLLSFASMAPNWLSFIQQTSNLQILTATVDKKWAKVGDYLNCTIIVANTTSNSLNNIVITDKIPTETSYVDGSATGNASFDATTKTLQWSIDSLLPNQMIGLSFKVKVEKAGLLTFSISNKAHLEGSGLSIDSNEVKTWLYLLSKSCDTATIKAGSEITYTIHYENGTGETLTNIKIIDQLPQYTSLEKGSTRSNPDYDPTTNQVTWTIDSLPPDAVGDISYKVKVLDDAPDGAQLTSTASLQVGDEKILDSNSVVTVVDKTPPTIRTFLPPSGISCLPVMVFEATDANPSPAGVDVKVDGQEVAPLFDNVSKYSFAIPTNILTPGSHTLTISATDIAGNSNEQTFTFNVSSQPFPQSQIELVSFPFHISGSLSSVVGTLEKACVWTGNSYSDANQISLYQGIWVKLASPFSPANLTLSGTIDTVNTGEDEVSIPLQKGWQAIGLPWTYPLPISALQIEDKNGNRFSFSQASNLVGKVLFRWDGTEYVNVGLQQGMENTLYPWFGYWIRVKDDCKLIFPKEPWNVQAKRASNLDGFCLPIKAVFSDGTSEDVYIGIGKEEITSPFPPPAPYSQNQKRLSIIKNGELLYIDIRREGGKQEWRLAVKGGATLFFPNLSYLPKGWQAILTDGDKKYYLKTTSAVKIEGDKELKVEIGEGMVTPLLINMLEARSVRGGVNISWNVNLPCQVKVAIKGADGRILRDLGMRSSSSGLNSLFWDGKGQDGRNLPAGIYIIELTARDELNQMIKAIRMVNLR